MAGRKKGAGRGTGKRSSKSAAKRPAGKGGARTSSRSAGKATKKTTRKAAKKAAKRSAGKAKRAAKAGGPAKPFAPVHTAADLRAIVERYIAAYNARDTAAILDLYDRRATMSDPIGLPPAVGHAAIAELYRMGFDMGVTIAPDGAVRCAGNSVAFPLVASSPSSQLHVIDVFDFGRNGKIAQMRAYWGPDNLVGELAIRQ